jgi:hypothetical protein
MKETGASTWPPSSKRTITTTCPTGVTSSPTIRRLSELDALGMGDVGLLRSWMDDFDANRERGDNQKADDKWRQAEKDLKKLLAELQNSPAEEPDTGEETAPGE